MIGQAILNGSIIILRNRDVIVYNVNMSNETVTYVTYDAFFLIINPNGSNTSSRRNRSRDNGMDILM